MPNTKEPRMQSFLKWTFSGGKKGKFGHYETKSLLCAVAVWVARGQQKKTASNPILFLFQFANWSSWEKERPLFLSTDSTAMSTWSCRKPTLCGAIALEEPDGQGQKRLRDSDSVLKKSFVAYPRQKSNRAHKRTQSSKKKQLRWLESLIC